MAVTTPSLPQKALGTDAAKEGGRLLDIISVADYVGTALLEFVEQRKDILPLAAVKDIGVLVEALDCVYREGRRQTSKVSTVGYIVEAHDMRRKSNHQRPNLRVFGSLWRSKEFVRKCNSVNLMRDDNAKGEMRTPKKVPLLSLSSQQYKRRSDRIINAITPDKEAADMLRQFDGRPPDGDAKWSKEKIVAAIDKLEEMKEEGVECLMDMDKSTFITNVIVTELSPYTSTRGIYKMHKKWKETGMINREGQPSIMKLGEAEAAVKNVLRDCSSDSSAFKLSDMKNAYAEKRKDKAALDGLDPDSINSSISTRTAKVALIAVAMGDSDISLSNKVLLTKTEKRFQSEHSIMGAYAYACTVLSTHFIEGPCPKNLAHLKPHKLSASALETIEWVKEAYGSEEIHPVDPNLILSTDDTTLFVFEGAADGRGDWEWKIIDKTNGDSSVRSDFQVGEDAESSGGLRVRLTVTFTASGLAAPPYVAVSGLTESELSVDKCPDGILAAEVEHLCKGGDDLFNKGTGWLVFLCVDGRDKKTQDKEHLSIANKKILHYNDEVLLPFIRSIREKLGWKPGQPVPDWLKACSWFDGDIGQLQTMLYEAREALDDVEKIVHNKHSAASTGTQQPCDLSPVFRLMKQMQMHTTAKDSVACGLRETIEQLFSVDLRLKGLNLDRNPRKKKSLIDFLLCLPELLEATMKKRHIIKSFVEAGMIDEETNVVPEFDKLMGTCKRWVSCSKEIGVPKADKDDCRSQFQHLMKLQLQNGQLSYPDMREAGIPIGMFQL